MSSIRVRIGLAVFTVVIGLLAVQMAVVLERLERDLRYEVDERLREEIHELQPMLGTPQLQTFIDVETMGRTKWNEVFFEIRDGQGRIVAKSHNVADTGLPGMQSAVEGDKEQMQVREEVHPASRKRHRRIRIAETTIGPYRVQMAASLKRQQKRYWLLRRQLLYALLVVATFGAAAAYAVATRALAPVRRATARARELEMLGEGELPRTGSGDEIDALAEVLNDLLRRIRGEVARMRRLTAEAGHALRTPLTAIRGNLELQLGRLPQPEAEVLGAVLEDVDRLVRLVNELLLLEKLESSPDPLPEVELIDVGPLARDLVENLRVLADERDIELECTVEPASVRGDAAQLRQALLNLLDNALRHTPRGGHTTVQVRREHSRVRIAVSDTGPGLGPEEPDRLFERFYSGPGGERAGTGLGLPIARAIARAHGGELHASSPGGALFVLELPLATRD